jgi:succinyl-CoA synthetase beta subunit
MVARGILQVEEQQEIHIPIILRVMGEGSEEAYRLLSHSAIRVFSDFDTSIQETVRTANRLSEVSVE